jgi:hypothetical protein
MTFLRSLAIAMMILIGGMFITLFLVANFPGREDTGRFFWDYTTHQYPSAVFDRSFKVVFITFFACAYFVVLTTKRLRRKWLAIRRPSYDAPLKVSVSRVDSTPALRRNDVVPPRFSEFALRGQATPMIDQGPRYARSAEATATIINLMMQNDVPQSRLFGQIQLCIIEAMRRVSNDEAR